MPSYFSFSVCDRIQVLFLLPLNLNYKLMRKTDNALASLLNGTLPDAETIRTVGVGHLCFSVCDLKQIISLFPKRNPKGLILIKSISAQNSSILNDLYICAFAAEKETLQHYEDNKLLSIECLLPNF